MISGKIKSMTMNGIEITGETDQQIIFTDFKNKIFCSKCGKYRSLKRSHSFELIHTNGKKQTGWLCGNCHKIVATVYKEFLKYKK